MNLGAETIRSKLVTKAVRNVRRGYQEDESTRGMYREGIKLDLTRSRLLTESYKETDGQPMVMRRVKALDNILSKMPIYIQDWERIVGSNVADSITAVKKNVFDDKKLTMDELLKALAAGWKVMKACAS